MKILAIETSCDETAISIVEAAGNLNAPQFKILAHQISSQVALHARYGGVVPSIAKREHSKLLIPILIATLKEAVLYQAGKIILPIETQQILNREPELLTAVENNLTKITKPKIDAIAVTRGPGLEPALWVGINLAKLLALTWDLPLIPTNHLEGHLISPLAADHQSEMTDQKINFPAIALIISGGHTELILLKNWCEYEKIGQTRDDAVGEAFDKVARLLGLPYPGGPALSKLATQANLEVKLPNGSLTSKRKWQLPRPMLHSGDYDFSFSGLKTAVLYTIKNYTAEQRRELNGEEKASLAREV